MRAQVTDVSRAERPRLCPSAEHWKKEGPDTRAGPQGDAMARRTDPRVQTLSTMTVLSGASARQLQEVCGLTTEVRFPAGRVLCRQGADAQEVFLLAEGQVAVSRDDVPLGVVGPGGVIGEMALLDRQARSATTTAITDVTALVLSRSEFSQLLHRFPGVADNVRALSAMRTEQIATRCA